MRFTGSPQFLKELNQQSTERKTKNLQPRILHIARLPFRIGEIKSFRQTKVKGIHHHQTSPIRNGKGDS